MVKADLKEISISDDVYGLGGQFYTEQPFSVPLHATIGVAGRDGGDLFVFQICNLKWLTAVVADGTRFINKTWVCDGLTLAQLREAVSNLVSSFDGDDWVGLVKRLSAISHWEFEK